MLLLQHRARLAQLLEPPQRERLLLLDRLAPVALVACAVPLGSEQRLERPAHGLERRVGLEQLIIRVHGPQAYARVRARP